MPRILRLRIPGVQQTFRIDFDCEAERSANCDRSNFLACEAWEQLLGAVDTLGIRERKVIEIINSQATNELQASEDVIPFHIN